LCPSSDPLIPFRPLPADGTVRPGAHVRLINPSVYASRTWDAATGIAMKVGFFRTRVRWTSERICSVPTGQLRVIPDSARPPGPIHATFG
jgi:hypothetical protein